MESRVRRKSKKVFLGMSKVVKTRTPDQCRSHHQKVLTNHPSLSKIIEHYKEYMFGKQVSDNEKYSKPIRNTGNGEKEIDMVFKIYQIKNRFRIEINANLIEAYQPE